MLEVKGSDCVFCGIVTLVQTVLLVPLQLKVGVCLLCSVSPDSVSYCPLEARAGHCSSSSSHYDNRLVCALIGRSWNILFYLIMCSPATQPPVSQSAAGPADPIRFQTGELGQYLVETSIIQHNNHDETVKSVSVAVRSWISGLHAQHLAAKQELDRLRFFLVYQTTTFLLIAHKCPACVFLCFFY